MIDSTLHTFRVLVINAGSSSVKFGVFDAATNRQLFKSEVEGAASIEDAIGKIPALLKTKGIAALDAVGHRVAHG